MFKKQAEKNHSRELKWIASLFGGTVVAVVIPAVVSLWMVYVSIIAEATKAIIVHGLLAVLQAAAIWNVYRVKHAGIVPIMFPSCIAALHLIIKLFVDLETGGRQKMVETILTR